MKAHIALMVAVLASSSAARSGNFTNITKLACSHVLMYCWRFIGFSKDLACEACIRGGYELCNELKEAKFVTTCEEHPRVNPAKDAACASPIPDEINAMVKLCAADTQAQRHPSCGEYRVNLKNNSDIQFRTVASLPLGQSCMYRVHSKCGYPKARVTVVDFRIEGDFDVAYAALDGFKEEQDLTFESPTLET
jgi:hypothetical protein